MSRLSFATINDAFGIQQFTPSDEESYKITSEPTEFTKPIETFIDFDKITCEVVKNHCTSCDCMKSKNNFKLNEILNLMLIGILLYILLLRPKI